MTFGILKSTVTCLQRAISTMIEIPGHKSSCNVFAELVLSSSLSFLHTLVLLSFLAIVKNFLVIILLLESKPNI